MPNKLSLYREIMRKYNYIQDKESANLRQRQNEVYAKIPRIKEIENEINLTGVKISKLVLMHPENINTYSIDLRRSIDKLKSEKETLLNKNGFPKNYLTIKYHCENCKDTGYINSKPCSCFKQKMVDSAYNQSSLREILKLENFDYFNPGYYLTDIDKRYGMSPRENIEAILKVCLKFTNNFGNEFSNLFLHGESGLGKTFLCNCIAKELLDKGKTIMYVTSPQLFKIIENDRFSRKEDEEPSGYMDDILSVDLFILDDLGTEFPTILSNSELFNIINTRILDKKPVIISTNLDLKELTDLYSDRIVSRIMGDYKTLKFFGGDIRALKRLSSF